MMHDIQRHAPIPQSTHHHRRHRQQQQGPTLSTVLVTGNHSKCHSRKERGWVLRWRSILFLSLGTGQTPPPLQCSEPGQGTAERGLSSCSCHPAETPRTGAKLITHPSNQPVFLLHTFLPPMSSDTLKQAHLREKVTEEKVFGGGGSNERSIKIKSLCLDGDAAVRRSRHEPLTALLL